jgi:hypothetical protein
MKTIKDIIIESSYNIDEFEDARNNITVALDNAMVEEIKKLVKNENKQECINAAIRMMNEIHQQFNDEEVYMIFK